MDPMAEGVVGGRQLRLKALDYGFRGFKAELTPSVLIGSAIDRSGYLCESQVLLRRNPWSCILWRVPRIRPSPWLVSTGYVLV